MYFLRKELILPELGRIKEENKEIKIILPLLTSVLMMQTDGLMM